MLMKVSSTRMLYIFEIQELYVSNDQHHMFIIANALFVFQFGFMLPYDTEMNTLESSLTTL